MPYNRSNGYVSRVGYGQQYRPAAGGNVDFLATATNHWTFEEASGTIIDQIGSNDITVSGSAEYQYAGINSKAVRSTGSSVFMNTSGNLFDGSSDYTLIMWFKENASALVLISGPQTTPRVFFTTGGTNHNVAQYDYPSNSSLGTTNVGTRRLGEWCMFSVGWSNSGLKHRFGHYTQTDGGSHTDGFTFTQAYPGEIANMAHYAGIISYNVAFDEMWIIPSLVSDADLDAMWNGGIGKFA